MSEVIDLSAPKSNLKAFDLGQLYTRDTVIDMNAGEVVILRPVTVGLLRDTERPLRFFSSITAARRGQPVQLSFEIQAASLEEALEKWMGCANETAAEYHRKAEAQEIRSRLAVPAGARMPVAN